MSRKWQLALGLLVALVAAGPAAAQTTFVSDSFTVAANTMLEAHTPNTGGAWTRQTGGSGIILNAAAGNARNVAAGDWSVYTNAAVPGSAEVVIGASVVFTNANANNWVDLFGRASVSLLNAYQARFAANGNVSLIRYSGGAPTTLATGTVTVALNTPTEFILSLKNASKQIWINGVQVVSSADNTVAALGSLALGMDSNVAAQVTVDDVFGSTFAPTAVDRLEAHATRDGKRTLVEWTTAREVRNIGFRVYRDGVPISRELIAGAAFLAAGASLPAGNTYRFIDEWRTGAPACPDAEDRTGEGACPPSRYSIESIDIDGRGLWHGPIVARRGTIDPRVAASPTLTELPQHNSVVLRTRIEPTALAQSTSGRRRAVDPSVIAMANQQRIAAGNALKIAVDADGLYRVAPGDDVQTMRLYADGVEVPIAIDGDAILFYGRALDTPSTGTRTYWLVADGPGARMPASPSIDAPASARRSFMATASRRDKLLFLPSLRLTDGDTFLGPVVPADQTLQLRHIDRAAPATLEVTLQGASDSHHVVVSLNGQRTGDVVFDGTGRTTMRFDVPNASLNEGDNTISLTTPNGDADISVVVSVAINYGHTFDADDDRLLAVVDGGMKTSIGGFTSNDLQLVDITDPGAPIRIMPLSVANGSVTFTAPKSGSRTILATSKLLQPASVTHNEPASLQGADVVIITHPSFVDALAPLADLRRSQGLTATIVKTTAIYDEFNFGAKDPQAIRTFLRIARPRYVLLVGDASFDERNFLGVGDFDFVPTKLVAADLLATASDTWFTDFDDDGAADIPIGRLSVRTLDEARAEVAKIIAYENAASPARKIMMVSDADPVLDFNANALSVSATIPSRFDIVDVDAARSGTAAARQQILSGFGGAFIVDYIGHGSVETWSNDALLGRNDVSMLANGAPPIVVAMTCLNGYFHDVYSDSLAEALMRAPNGAVAVWASSALTSPEAQLPLNVALMNAIFASDDDVRLGDAVRAAQNGSFTPDLRKTFILFGDPAMRVRAGM
jgi:hypothetical protein